MLNMKRKGAKTIEDIDKLVGENVNYKKLKSFHAIILATNYVGLRNLYKLSQYHTWITYIKADQCY